MPLAKNRVIFGRHGFQLNSKWTWSYGPVALKIGPAIDFAGLICQNCVFGAERHLLKRAGLPWPP